VFVKHTFQFVTTVCCNALNSVLRKVVSNHIHVKNSRLNTGSACCDVVWNTLCCVLLPESGGLKHVNVKAFLLFFMGVNHGVLHQM
jgi:hypothetical protein